MNADREAHSRNSLQVRAPRCLTAAVREAAGREMTSTSEFVRRAVIKELRSNGIDPAAYLPAPTRSAVAQPVAA
jgi:hypothetical protein